MQRLGGVRNTAERIGSARGDDRFSKRRSKTNLPAPYREDNFLARPPGTIPDGLAIGALREESRKFFSACHCRRMRYLFAPVAIGGPRERIARFRNSRAA